MKKEWKMKIAELRKKDSIDNLWDDKKWYGGKDEKEQEKDKGKWKEATNKDKKNDGVYCAQILWISKKSKREETSKDKKNERMCIKKRTRLYEERGKNEKKEKTSKKERKECDFKKRKARKKRDRKKKKRKRNVI